MTTVPTSPAPKPGGTWQGPNWRIFINRAEPNDPQTTFVQVQAQHAGGIWRARTMPPSVFKQLVTALNELHAELNRAMLEINTRRDLEKIPIFPDAATIARADHPAFHATAVLARDGLSVVKTLAVYDQEDRRWPVLCLSGDDGISHFIAALKEAEAAVRQP